MLQFHDQALAAALIRHKEQCLALLEPPRPLGVFFERSFAAGIAGPGGRFIRHQEAGIAPWKLWPQAKVEIRNCATICCIGVRQSLM